MRIRLWEITVGKAKKKKQIEIDQNDKNNETHGRKVSRKKQSQVTKKKW